MKLEIDHKDLQTIEGSFFDIAQELLNKHVLTAAGHKFRITNIEFYYYNDKAHRDENCHRNNRQLLNSKWYLHKNSINLSYYRKGIDFTFGDGTNHGGILIKEAIKLDDNTKLAQYQFVNELIKALRPNGAEDFTKKIHEGEELIFERQENLKQHKIYQWKRVGLTKGSFKDSPYAFRTLLAKDSYR